MKQEVDKLNSIDKDIKNNAVQYFKAAKDCEELVNKYQGVKYSADISLQARQLVYQQMMNSIFLFKDCERKYKETVYFANNFLVKFRGQIDTICSKLKSFEEPRIELIHEAINSFVVF